MRLLPFAVLALCAPLSAPLHAQNADIFATPELNAFEYGILCYYSNDNPNTPLTRAQIDQISATTAFFDDVRASGATKIPGVAGLTFGVLSNYPTGFSYDVTSTITHTLRDGRVVEDTVALEFDDVMEIDGWSFDQVTPDIFGIYRFQTFRDGNVIYDLSFDVVPAAEFAGPLPDCVSG